MYDVEDVQEEGGGGLQDRIERFVGLYVSRYRRILDMSKVDSENMPEFYDAFPYKVQVYRFENETLGIFFLKGDEATIVSLVKGEFHEARWILEDKACERFIGLRSADEATPERADVLAEKDAERDISLAKKKQALADMEEELESLQGDITNMAKVNPWLEERAAGQIGKVSATRSVIENLDREVEDDKYNRFKEYTSQFDLLELHLPQEKPKPKPGRNEKIKPAAEVSDDYEDEIPTLSTILVDDSELEPVEENFSLQKRFSTPRISPSQRNARPPSQRPKRPQKTPPKPEPKKEAKNIRDNIPQKEDVSPEIKNTVFRMNRRLFTLEKKVEDLETLKPSEMKKLRREFSILSKEQRALRLQLKRDVGDQNARIKASSDAITSVLSEETRKIRKFAMGMGMLAIIFSLLALFLALSAMGYISL